MAKPFPVFVVTLLFLSVYFTYAESQREPVEFNLVKLPQLVEEIEQPTESDIAWIEKKQQLPVLNELQKQLIFEAIPASASAEIESTRRVLIFYRCEGFVHRSIPFANCALEQLGKQTGAFNADLADTYEVFTEANLEQYDAIIFNNTTRLVFPTLDHENAFKNFVTGGKGLIGIHAAADNFGEHSDCVAMVGGIFDSHPWTQDGTWAFRLDDPKHTLNEAFGGKGFWHQDEIYRYKENSFVGPSKLRLLVSLDMTKEAVTNKINDPQEVAVSWVQRIGEGRVFYTNFGHRNETFHKPLILRHMLDGIQYALGDLEAEDKPTAEIDRVDPALAPDV